MNWRRTIAKSLKEQSEAVLKKHLAVGSSKANIENIGNTTYKKFTSMRSYKESSSTLARIAKDMNVSKLKDINIERAQEYLNSRRDSERAGQNVLHVELGGRTNQRLLSQKTLDAERKSLSILLGEPIARVYSSAKKPDSSRSYRNDQVEIISKAQSPRNALSTKISLAAGLRAHELLQIRKASELQVTASRKWSDNRFDGLKGEKYVVIGKGGLIREVRIPHELSKELESRRHNAPVEVKDRGVKYKSLYDIGGGNSFSKSFSAASKRTLGWSNGAHGLRHQYAQSRLAHFKSKGYNDEEAKLFVSQELGHFRASIVEVYLK